MAFILMLLSLLGSVLWVVYLWQRVGGKTKPMRLKNTWQKEAAKVAADPYATMNDPRDAAVLLMLGMAECEGVISSGQKAAVIGNCMKYFESSPEEAAEFYAANSFLLKKTPSLEEMVKRLVPLIERECGPKERQELLDMMQNVAQADGGAMNQEQENMLSAVKTRLKIEN